MRGALYGVRIEGGAPARSAQAPFRAEGAAADILWAIVEAYDLALSDPTRVPPRSDGWHPVGTFVSDPMQKEAPAQGLKMVRNIDRWGFEPVPRIPPPPSSPVSPGPSSMAPPRR
jgi:hypothetical protein